MPDTTFEVLSDQDQSLIRRANKGAILIADADATIPATFTAGAGGVLQSLTGFTSLGYIAKDGAPTFRPEVESSDIESWGALEATRTDILSRKITVTFTAQETKKNVLELYSGLDLTDVEADATTNEIQYNDPTAPATRYNRFIFLMVDGDGDDAIYIMRILPRATVTEVQEQSWSQDGALTYGFTISAKVDNTLGYSLKNVIAGPGVASRLAGMDIPEAT